MTTQAIADAVTASPIDASELRQVLGSFVTGVTVITTVDAAGKRHGLTANSFTSVSLNPPLILWNQSITAPSYPVFRDAERFAVNILAEDQIEVSKRFSRPGADKFAGIETRSGLGGVPLIEGCTAYLECSRDTAFPGGDHVVFLGRVERIERLGRRPLVFGQGGYLMAQAHEYGEPAASPAASHAQLQAVRAATPAAVQLSRDLDHSVALSVWGSHGPTVIRWEQPALDPLAARLNAGQVCRLLTSATGLVWAANVAPALASGFIDAELAAPVDGAPCTNEEAHALLEDVRRHGVARVLGSAAFTHMYGTRISAIAAPVFDAQGRIVVALTVVGAADSFDADRDGAPCRALRHSAGALSRHLGHRAAPSMETR